MGHFAAIRIFIRVVETGSITRAAAHLSIPKSTASKLLGELEGNLGVKLLNRTTRAISLTEEGSRYYREIGPLLTRLGDIETELKSNGLLPKGPLRVDVHSAMANSVLIPILGEFRTQYPDIQLILGISDRPISLVEEAADCVIRMGPLPNTSLIARQLYEDRLITCASPLYLSRRGTPSSPDDLAQHHDLVGYFSATNGTAQPLVFHRDDSMQQLSRAHILTNDSTGQLGMLLAGFGIGQAYETTVFSHIESGELVPVLTDWTTPTSPVSIVYPPAKRNNQRVRAFVNWIVKRLTPSSV